MPAYILSVVEVTNVTDDFKRYVQLSAELTKRYGGEYVMRGAAKSILERKGGTTPRAETTREVDGR